MKTTYLVTLACAMDDVPLAVFETEAGVEAFCRENDPIPPFQDDEDNPITRAAGVADVRVSTVFGFRVWVFNDHSPVRTFDRKFLDCEEWPTRAEWRKMSEAAKAAYRGND